MGGFGSDWLALRETYDQRSRDRGLIERLKAWVPPEGALVVADLGSGTGAKLRAIAPALPCEQVWWLLEHDPALIEAAKAKPVPVGVTVRQREVDLAGRLEAILPREARLITASALLDLVSLTWLEGLVRLARARGTALYITLSYDGRRRWRPADPYDARALEGFNRHQHGAKSFGQALGPDAPAALRALLRDAPQPLHEASSDWVFGPGDREVQAAVLAGWREALLEAAPDEADEVEGWAAVRRGMIDAGRSRLTVGHVDQLWLPGA